MVGFDVEIRVDLAVVIRNRGNVLMRICLYLDDREIKYCRIICTDVLDAKSSKVHGALML
jgi:hypothetical protein